MKKRDEPWLKKMVLNHHTRNRFMHVIKVMNLADTSSGEVFLDVQIVEHNEIF